MRLVLKRSGKMDEQRKRKQKFPFVATFNLGKRKLLNLNPFTTVNMLMRKNLPSIEEARKQGSKEAKNQKEN